MLGGMGRAGSPLLSSLGIGHPGLILLTSDPSLLPPPPQSPLQALWAYSASVSPHTCKDGAHPGSSPAPLSPGSHAVPLLGACLFPPASV